MDEETAYFLGLLVGGGTINENNIVIDFPFQQWPNTDPRIALDWFQQSVQQLCPMIERLLNTRASPNTNMVHLAPGQTPRFSIDIAPVPQILYGLLRQWGLPTIGTLRKSASIATLMSGIDDRAKKKFISGFADVVGSCRTSHRNRSTNTTIISFEIFGENWKLPLELCQTLHSLGVPVDQILWHHPNMHAGSSPHAYWKKGHKVRVRACDFARINYTLDCKRRGLEQLLDEERITRGGTLNYGTLCPNRSYRVNGRKCSHEDENSTDLPPQVRGHFIHYTHICQAMGCPHAPSSWLRRTVPRYPPAEPSGVVLTEEDEDA